MSLTFADVVRERDSWHVAKRPTQTFRAVLLALVDAGEEGARVHELARAAGVDHAGATRVLLRMRRLDLARRAAEPGAAGLRGGWRYWATEDGRALAETLRGGA